ncbi:hypothetical protein V8E36_000150 [Tilletia maclaganii]
MSDSHQRHSHLRGRGLLSDLLLILHRHRPSSILLHQQLRGTSAMADTRSAPSPQNGQSRSPTQPRRHHTGVSAFQTLPTELLVKIFDNLDYLPLNALRMTCSTFAAIIRDKHFDHKLYRTRLDANKFDSRFNDAMFEAFDECFKDEAEVDRDRRRYVDVSPDPRAIRTHPLLQLMEVKIENCRLFVRWPIPVARSTLKDEVVSYATPCTLFIALLKLDVLQERVEAFTVNSEGITIDEVLRHVSNMARKYGDCFYRRLAEFSRARWLVDERFLCGNGYWDDEIDRDCHLAWILTDPTA